MNHDKTSGSVWCGSHDHVACACGVLAVSHCGYLYYGFACAGSDGPPIDIGLEKTWLGDAWILILLYLVGLGGFGSCSCLLAGTRSMISNNWLKPLSVRGAWSMPLWLEGSSFQNLLVTWLPVPAVLFEAMTGEQGQFVLPAMLNVTEGIGTFVSGAFLILFLSIYWSINQIHFERLWLSLLPSEQRKHARGIWRMIEPDLGAYIRSELIQSLLAVLLLSIGYWLLGSPYPVLLALLGALAWLVPVVGVATGSDSAIVDRNADQCAAQPFYSFIYTHYLLPCKCSGAASIQTELG
jgi:hypothetical protein